MATELVLHMNGGVGETSYANNSELQRRVILQAQPILEESIVRLYCRTSPNSIKVADLGCSSGPNSLLVASNIINIVDTTRRSLNRDEPLTFQFFLNDLFGNDFNTIFKSLPDFYKRLQQDKGDKSGHCFVNGTPGSFYGRLFPNNSIHLFHSSYSLHWLSQPPMGMTKGTESLNKGNCYIINTSPPAVYRAYLEQFGKDFKLFLESRSEEIVPGGAMVLTFIGRDETRSSNRTTWEVIGMILHDMVLENLIEEEKLDCFNLPKYGPTAEEVREVIQEEGSFAVQRLEVMTMAWDGNLFDGANDTVVGRNMRAEFISNCMRAVTESILKAHFDFGKAVMDEFFVRYAKKLVQLMETEKLEYANLVMSLIKS